MDESKQNLAAITRREVALYAGNTHGGKHYPVLDDKNQTYAVIYVPEDEEERPAYAVVMAHLVDDFIVIDEDRSLDKPLYEALMVNDGIPREKIVLAYEGETIPSTK